MEEQLKWRLRKDGFRIESGMTKMCISKSRVFLSISYSVIASRDSGVAIQRGSKSLRVMDCRVAIAPRNDRFAAGVFLWPFSFTHLFRPDMFQTRGKPPFAA
tara:strand:+ start:1302 stop:1607 length:306 start_codon:yes stop_codon:yes gene_type:complete